MSSVDRPIPSSVETFRTEFRATGIGPRYSGWLHFAFTSTVALGVVALAVSRIHEPSWLEWLVVPASFLLANLAEYFGHKHPMHHKTRLSLLFERHTRQHHQFFTHDAMAYGSARDFKMVLFPPVMIVFFLGFIATPIAGVAFLVASSNAGWLFVATAVGYFLVYEWLHFAYHLPEASSLGRLWLIRGLRRHHTTHHDKGLMSHYNFNITFPIADTLFGTRFRGERHPGHNAARPTKTE